MTRPRQEPYNIPTYVGGLNKPLSIASQNPYLWGPVTNAIEHTSHADILESLCEEYCRVASNEPMRFSTVLRVTFPH